MIGKLHEASISVTEYFLVSIFTWLTLDDQAARLAARAAALTASGEQRDNMFKCVDEIVSQLESHIPGRGDERKRILELRTSVYEQPEYWKGTINAKKALKAANRQYWKAMSNWYGKADPDVFVRCHPDIQPFRELIRQSIAEAPKVRRPW